MECGLYICWKKNLQREDKAKCALSFQVTGLMLQAGSRLWGMTTGGQLFGSVTPKGPRLSQGLHVSGEPHTRTIGAFTVIVVFQLLSLPPMLTLITPHSQSGAAVP